MEREEWGLNHRPLFSRLVSQFASTHPKWIFCNRRASYFLTVYRIIKDVFYPAFFHSLHLGPHAWTLPVSFLAAPAYLHSLHLPPQVYTHKKLLHNLLQRTQRTCTHASLLLSSIIHSSSLLLPPRPSSPPTTPGAAARTALSRLAGVMRPPPAAPIDGPPVSLATAEPPW